MYGYNVPMMRCKSHRKKTEHNKNGFETTVSSIRKGTNVMKSKQELLKMLYVILAELQSGTLDRKPELKVQQQTRLELLYDILGEDVPEEYWEQIEKEI